MAKELAQKRSFTSGTGKPITARSLEIGGERLFLTSLEVSCLRRVLELGVKNATLLATQVGSHKPVQPAVIGAVLDTLLNFLLTGEPPTFESPRIAEFRARVAAEAGK